jgi:Right handed beta helix region
MRKLLLLSIACVLSVPSARALSFQSFVKCLSAQGTGDVCRLDAGSYLVSQTIQIGRSRMIIEGTLHDSSRATTLMRAPGFEGALLSDFGPLPAPLKLITIRDLTFDGDRARNSAGYYFYNPEVMIFSIEQLQVINSGFINSPGVGLALYGGAGTADVVVSKSYFANPVIYGLWSDANLTYSDCSANQFVHHVTVATSKFENAGEPAILGNFIDLQLIENVFTNNHSNSIPFDDDGGQIDLTTCTQNALIVKNTFQDGSASSNGHVADGIELHGTDIQLIDNTVKYNSGDGINMDGVQHVYIANWDPKTGSFENGGSGIAIAHSSYTFRLTKWITVESAISTGNAQWGIWSDTSNTTPDQPVSDLTIADSCLSGNAYGPTYLINLGADVILQNNQTTGCAPK